MTGDVDPISLNMEGGTTWATHSGLGYPVVRSEVGYNTLINSSASEIRHGAHETVSRAVAGRYARSVNSVVWPSLAQGRMPHPPYRVGGGAG